MQPDVEWAADELPEETPHYASTGLSWEGWKRYELSNHLGNVLSVVNDRKSSVDDNEDGVADYYVPAILSATDYYPFGTAGTECSLAHSFQHVPCQKCKLEIGLGDIFISSASR